MRRASLCEQPDRRFIFLSEMAAEPIGTAKYGLMAQKPFFAIFENYEGFMK
ncbi:hypothetical protein [uncultured Agrobacterium sp.]|uniref:hypothetical protein n=1 Tax=uncultured Agrobacterium sp. TaxID=157277 RepID=UPI0025F402D7|nr:hypothetical protein [uncultured Agrobacterium sp.]